MIRFLTHKQIDKQQWDNCIEHAANRLIYAYSWYLDAICPKWNALVLNNYEAVMPLPTTRKFFTIAYQPFFTQQLGVFGKSTEKLFVRDFINHIPTQYKYINVCINPAHHIPKHIATERANYVLPLYQSYAETYKNFSEHCRRNIKKSERNKLVIQDCDPSEVVDFYIAHKGEETSVVKPKHYDVLKKVLAAANSCNMLKSYQVVNERGAVLAAAAYYVQPKRIIYQIGTTTELGKEQRAMYFLFDSIIRKHSNKPVILDFEGSEIYGIARFFQGFGAVRQPYYRIVINRLPWPFNLLKR